MKNDFFNFVVDSLFLNNMLAKLGKAERTLPQTTTQNIMEKSPKQSQ